MNERPADKLWKEMTSQEVEHFFKLLAHRADCQSELANSTTIELAKYLFAANTGAAAGMFLLLKSSSGQIWYLVSFFSFCLGTTFVGICYLAFVSWSQQLADGTTRDINAWGRNEITIAGLDVNNWARYASRKRAWIFLGLKASFSLLLIGGLMAGFAFCKATFK